MRIELLWIVSFLYGYGALTTWFQHHDWKMAITFLCYAIANSTLILKTIE